MSFTIYARGATRFGEVLKPRTEIGYFGMQLPPLRVGVPQLRHRNENLVLLRI